MSEAYKKIIREIKRKMFARGMNIRMTAEALGCHRETLSQHLNLRMAMRADLMLKAIDYFEIDVNQVLGIPHGVAV